MKKLIFASFAAICLFMACSKSGTSNMSTTGTTTSLDCSTVGAKTYATDISPIIQSKCATNGTCHGSGSTNGPGPLINYTSIFNARSLIRSAIASGTMPKTGSISVDQKNSILCWIDAGAQNN